MMNEPAPSVIIFALFAGFISWRPASSQRHIAGINIANPSLLNVFIHDSSDPTSRYSIPTSTYDTNRNTYDNAIAMLYPAQTVGSNFTGMDSGLISNLLFWPKEITQVPGYFLLCLFFFSDIDDETN